MGPIATTRSWGAEFIKGSTRGLRMGSIGTLSLCLLSALMNPPAQAGTAPWWDSYPRVYYGGTPTEVANAQANVSFDVGLMGPGFGTYGLRAIGTPSSATAAHNRGLKYISYYETFGTSQLFIAEIGPSNGEYRPPKHTHWDWQSYSGGEIQWVGALSWFDDQAFARPYTRTHPVYGGDPMRYPDGTIATGYMGDPANPLNHRVYDAGASKNVLGQYTWKEDYEPSNSTVQTVGPHTGLVLHNGVYYGRLGPGKDSACPWWLEMDRAMVQYAASQGLDGIWTDNFSAWNSFSWRPVEEGFGEWSVALFRDYLATHFSPTELAAMGVADVTVFDIRSYLRQKVVSSGGNDTNLSDTRWSAASWQADPVWRAYLIFKRQKGTEALGNYYSAVKEAAAAGGKTEFLVAGNDIPVVSLGWPRGALDLVSTEYSYGSSIDTGSIGMMLPPAGRQGIRFKLAREHAKSPMVNAWPYFDDSSANTNQHLYRTNNNVVKLVFYEMLAHNVTPMMWPANTHFAGTSAQYAALYSFITANSAFWGTREPVEDVGVYYSSSSTLMQMTPGGFLDLNNQPHQHGLYGWGMALDKLHYTYRVIPHWKLTSNQLASIKVLVIPNAEVLSPADASILIGWVTDGGRLIVTGDSGKRLGEEGNFAVNPSGFSLSPLTGLSSLPSPGFTSAQTVGAGKVVYIRDNIGADYYSNPARPNSALAAFAAALDSAWTGASGPILVATGVPPTTGFTVYRSTKPPRLYVDVYNTNIDLPSDTITPTGALSVQVAVPDMLDVPDLGASAISPDGGVTVNLAKSGTTATLNISSVTSYASIVLQFPDTDGDYLSNATEALLGTNPSLADTDVDGLSDYAEVTYDGVLGYVPNSDTDPLAADTDNDGINDYIEIGMGFDPLDSNSFPPNLPLKWWPLTSVLGLFVLTYLWRRKLPASAK